MRTIRKSSGRGTWWNRSERLAALEFAKTTGGHEPEEGQRTTAGRAIHGAKATPCAGPSIIAFTTTDGAVNSGCRMSHPSMVPEPATGLAHCPRMMHSPAIAAAALFVNHPEAAGAEQTGIVN